MVNKIDVFYHNVKVGTIAGTNNRFAFQYSDTWLEHGFSISPFSLPLTKDVFVPQKSTFGGLFGAFSDSLPDSWGRLLLKRYLKQNHIEIQNGLEYLMYIGNNGMGALEYRPSYTDNRTTEVNFDEYQKQSTLVLDDNTEANIDLLFKNGASSGGARPKALVKYQNEDWIIKFQSRFDIDNIGLCEYEYALACKEIGIEMPDVLLFPSIYNKGYFGVKRFDRLNGNKIHMISASALLEVDFEAATLDYLDLFKLTKIITRDNKTDLEQLYLRMCFNVYAHNLDNHLKNFSYLFDERINSYRLSPAYDIVYSNTYYAEHTTTINQKGRNITDDDLIIVGTKSGLTKAFCIQKLQLIKDVVNNRLAKYL